ncbi:vWA domain-containing protein [Evansella cellulosilytica]|uniref:von Willebrand factor type A n=1 Tax=Evansella cellulosilytica (strain ATCC 21833 / DSM 2522 / FERM P-1141 / JCM 9156 / N-4) TaxID=649639 RepID=E6TR32_EVAC2|nr:VWA domain-containing protein [Evansella cellulosilytica]ADU29408.1 von Willebrand factor type A [Evansella cellulosilytica DSM 2522]
MSSNVKLSFAHQYENVPCKGKEAAYLLVELTGAKVKHTERSPINLSLLLDRSGSMSGEPLRYCKEACNFVINQLTDKDILSVVVFDDQVETIIEPQKVTHKDLLKEYIQRIETRGITNLSGGLIQGCQHVLKQEVKNYVNRVILLSDGQANAGITDKEALVKLADDYQSAGLVISTLGVSEHFDEELLEGVADSGRGNFHFINEVENIPSIFEQELDGLLNVIGQNITLNILPKKGVRITNVFGYNYNSDEDAVDLTLGDSFQIWQIQKLKVNYKLLPQQKC